MRGQTGESLMKNPEVTPAPGVERKPGKVFLAFAGLCILALPLIAYQAFSTTNPPAQPLISGAAMGYFDQKGAAVFRFRDRITAAYLQGASTGRTLEEYYARRQYPGSPPFIPHRVEPNDETNRTCLACHADGGWSQQLKANTPLTPHPDQTACRQCHVVPTEGVPLFKGIDWQSLPPPRLGRPYLPGAPPPIPHDLQNRGACIACHVGPGTVAALRVEHSMRGNCRQCHVPDLVEGTFRRKSDY
jgi:cytochrome c-type protein NapB